jgi:methionyl-tRNA synthetase
MSDTPKTFYLTTPIYYVNARPHIGHAYSTIVADVLARRHRLLGEDTFFLTGTDEHGQKIERSAAAAGIPPQQFADQVSASFEALWKRMGITNNDYIRTTEPRHKLGAQKLFRTLYENGFIYLASYTGSYCVSDEAFVDAPVGTPCPDCGRLLEEVTEENFFFKLSQFQEKLLEEIYSKRILITPESAENEVLSFLAGPAISVAETFRPKTPSESDTWTTGLGLEEGFAKDLLKKVVATENGVTKTLYYIPGRLKDLSISRSSFTWGIPVPPDIQAKEKTKQPHVIYVWLDALANYMTALGYGSDDETLWEKFWPADLHLVGKEITRFHCVYWPAFLLAAGLPLPRQITANGWLLFDNSKMSKSKGNVVRTETILDAFGTLCPPTPTPPWLSFRSAAEESASPEPPTPLTESTDRRGTASAVPSDTPENGALAPEAQPTPHDRDLFAADILRYYLLREIPFGQDGSFSFDSLITRYNADLANGYGNLVSRTLSMIDKYFSGVLPAQSETTFDMMIATRRDKGNELDIVTVGSGGIATEIEETEHLKKPLSANIRRALTERVDSIVLAIKHFEDLRFDKAIEATFLLIQAVDSHISDRAPWKLAKSADEADQLKLSQMMYSAAESIRIITALLYPILPYATARVWAQLGLGDIEAAAREGKLKGLQWGDLKPGTKLGPLGPIFPRAPKELAQIMTDLENPTPEPTTTTDPGAPPRTASLDAPTGTLPVAGSTATTSGPNDIPSHTQAQASGIFAQQPPAAAPESPDTTPQITIDDFAKIDLRVAQITLAERIPKADKLLRLEVDLGPLGTRQILSGIAEFYTPEELIGRRIVVITNLAPRKMRGLESHGMLLAASDPAAGDHGKPALATCGDEIPLGSRLK